MLDRPLAKVAHAALAAKGQYPQILAPRGPRAALRTWVLVGWDAAHRENHLRGRLRRPRGSDLAIGQDDRAVGVATDSEPQGNRDAARERRRVADMIGAGDRPVS